MVRTREQVPLTCDRPMDFHTPSPVEALVTDPEALLTHGYRQAREITRAHGTTFTTDEILDGLHADRR